MPLEPRINGCVLQKLAPTDAHPFEITATVVAHQQGVQKVQFQTGMKSPPRALEQCLAGVVASARFPLDFRAGPVTATQRWATLGPVDRSGRFRASYAPVLFHQATPASLTCAAQHLPAPRAPLQVLLEATLSPEGKLSVTRVVSLPEGQSNEAFEGCLRGAVEAISGPKFKGSEAKLTHVFALPPGE